MYQLLKCLTETSGTLTRLFNIKKRGRPEKRVSQNFLGDFSLLFAVALQILSTNIWLIPQWNWWKKFGTPTGC